MAIVKTSIDVNIRTLTAKGVPQSASSLNGIVLNSLGEQVFVFSFENLTETALGVYEYLNFDLTDYNLFPGSTFTIFWCSEDSEVSPEETFQYCNFQPNSPVQYKHKILTWCPYSHKRLFGFRINRKLPSETSFTEYDFSYHNWYFDTGTYTSTYQLKATQWQVQTMLWNPTDDADPVFGPAASGPQLTLYNEDFCVVSGKITDVRGLPELADSVYFYVHEDDAPMSSGSRFIARRNEVVAPVNNNGDFAVPLIQGAYVTCQIPDAGFSAKFVVPCQDICSLSDLTLIEIEPYRGQ